MESMAATVLFGICCSLCWRNWCSGAIATAMTAKPTLSGIRMITAIMAINTITGTTMAAVG